MYRLLLRTHVQLRATARYHREYKPIPVIRRPPHIQPHIPVFLLYVQLQRLAVRLTGGAGGGGAGFGFGGC